MTSIEARYGVYSAHQKPTVGDTKTSVIAIDHLGWLLCDGRSLVVNDYLFLFNVIGYSFGGSGANFNLPNPAGRVAGFIGSGSGLSVRRLGDLSGAETHTLTIPQMPAHTHTGQTDLSGTGITVNDPGHTHSYVNQPNTANPAVSATTMGVADNDNVNQTTGSSTTGITLTDPRHRHNFTTNSTGGSLPHNNIQPTIFMGNMYIYSGKPSKGTYYPYTIFTPYDTTKLIY